MQNCEVGPGTGTYSRKGSQGGRPTQRGFQRPRLIGRRGSGASPRPRGLGKRLQHVREILEVLPVSGGEWAYQAPAVWPDLKVYACPEGLSGGGAPLGLSKESNSQNRSRPGLSGMPNRARRVMRSNLALMEDVKDRLAMWTVTLPDEDYPLMAGNDIWPRFQRRVVDLLIRHLKAQGDEALVVAVVEIGDLRARRTGRPMPHIHVVTSGWHRRARKGGGWVLSPAVMDGLVAKAAQYAGLPSRERSAASNLAPIRKSVVSYVSKYLTKQAGVSEVDLSDGYESLIPRQWWNRSKAAVALLEGHLFSLPPAFAAFLVARWKVLEGMELGRGGPVQVGVRKTLTGELPVEVFRFKFRSPEALHCALEVYACWCLEERRSLAEGG